MNNDGVLYDFFLEARRSLVTLWEDQLPLSELRSIAEEKTQERTEGAGTIRYLGDVLQRESLNRIPELVLDSALLRSLGRGSPNLDAISQASVVAAFLPLQFGIMSFFLQEGMEEPGFSLEDFSALRTSLHPGQQLLRTGFFSTEFDVLESAAFGFNGICLHARHLDHYQIQYLTELCRDFKMSSMIIVDSQSTLSRVLQTDAPYIGIWGYTAKDLKGDFSLFDRLSSKLPATCLSMALYPNSEESDFELLRSLGFHAALC